MTAIEAAGLKKAFGSGRAAGRAQALDGLGLSVPRGTVCALLGPNGAGKTTAVRILATLTKPDAGTAIVAGHDVTREPRKVRALIGLAGQHAAVDDDLTGRENLFILGLMYHLGRKAARGRAGALLDQFGLADAGDRLVKTWSGGMRRRLDVVASLIVSPQVLFPDEPTTGLDPRSRAEIRSAVRALAADGTTIMLTTQYLDEADQLAGQIVIIDQGKAVAQGTPDELKDTLAAAERLLLKLRHDPAAIVLTLGAPVALVVIFGYIFGSAIALPGGGDYRAYLVSGLFATIAANIVPSMVAVARDSTRGVVDRFRSLPITRSAVPFGQAAATAVYGLASFLLMALCGLAVGWRIGRGAADAVAALGLLVAFQFAATWVGIYLGLLIGKEETAAQASILVFPVTMVSNVFVPTAGMPAWLRAIADWNPVSALAAASRQLFGTPEGPAGAWPLAHPVAASLAWTALLLAVFVPLATARYARPG